MHLLHCVYVHVCGVTLGWQRRFRIADLTVMHVLLCMCGCRKKTLRLEPSPEDPTVLRLSFSFSATAPCRCAQHKHLLSSTAQDPFSCSTVAVSLLCSTAAVQLHPWVCS
jgi:hypothetical protein